MALRVEGWPLIRSDECRGAWCIGNGIGVVPNDGGAKTKEGRARDRRGGGARKEREFSYSKGVPGAQDCSEGCCIIYGRHRSSSGERNRRGHPTNRHMTTVFILKSPTSTYDALILIVSLALSRAELPSSPRISPGFSLAGAAAHVAR